MIFHQYMMTLGMVGPSSSAERFQNTYHDITGNKDTKGWSNQLEDNFYITSLMLMDIKHLNVIFSYGKMDIINNFRVDVGNYNRGFNGRFYN